MKRHVAKVRKLPFVERRELDHLRAGLSLADGIGLALRRTRLQTSQSQREYAAARSWSASHQARLETHAELLRVREVCAALTGSDFVLTLGWGREWHAIEDPAALAAAVVPRLRALGRSTRSAATACGLSASMVARIRSPSRAGTVRVVDVERFVEKALVGELLLGMWVAPTHNAGDAAAGTRAALPVNPDTWPAADVLPRVRGRSRRLAAHREIKRRGPFWFRWSTHADLGRPPLWTTDGSGPIWSTQEGPEPFSMTW
ncbi:MAG: hypothetical protein Q4G67_06445 [Actinomycetia bacterium]|nr:hypothetical protein [Actinomycetes bacterium]